MKIYTDSITGIQIEIPNRIKYFVCAKLPKDSKLIEYGVIMGIGRIRAEFTFRLFARIWQHLFDYNNTTYIVEL